jgi:hypothetical protein
MQKLQVQEGRCMKDFKYLRLLVYLLNETSLQLQVYLIYSTEESLFFQHNPENTDTSLQSRQELQNSDAVQIGFTIRDLASQFFTDSTLFSSDGQLQWIG